MTKRYTDEQNIQWQASLPKKKIAVKVIVRSANNTVLLVKPDYKDTWQLLGGGVEANEDPRQAAVRESKEEANIDIDVDKLKIIGTAFKATEDYLFLIYEYREQIEETADYSVDDEEIEEYRFVPIEDVAALLPDYYKEFWTKYISQDA